MIHVRGSASRTVPSMAARADARLENAPPPPPTAPYSTSPCASIMIASPLYKLADPTICAAATTAPRRSAGSPNANTRTADTHMASGDNRAPLPLAPSATPPRPARPLGCDDTPSGTRSADESDRGLVFAVSADSPSPPYSKVACRVTVPASSHTPKQKSLHKLLLREKFPATASVRVAAFSGYRRSFTQRQLNATMNRRFMLAKTLRSQDLLER